jgi:putative DNA-binding protein
VKSHIQESHLKLARQQSLFASRVLSAPEKRGPFKNGEGFAVYHRNLLAVAESALSTTFPTLRRLAGHGDFQFLVKELLKRHPPTLGDWGEWGEELPQLIECTALGRDYSFIAPVAMLDWLRHRANRAADNKFDRSTAQLLQTRHLDDVGIGIARNVGLISSVYPLLEIIDWHSAPGTDSGKLQVSEQPRPVLVYRRNFRVEQLYMDSAQHLFIRGLQAGRSVGVLLDELAADGFDFPAWIEWAIKQNLIKQFYVLKEA